MNDEHGIWNEIFRPKEFGGVINLPPQIPSLVNENLPHLLFYGPAGVGKTTTARIIIKKLGVQCLELNASDERGIDVIREKVKNFAGTKSFNGKIKIIFLDECDGLTNPAQESLRNIIEKYHKFCRFIGSANYINRIIPPLRSRFSLVEFKNPERADIKHMCETILKEKNIKYEEKDIDQIVEKCYPDIRKTINVLQLSVKDNVLDSKAISKQSSSANKIYELLKNKNFPEIRKLIISEGVDLDGALIDIEQKIFEDTNIGLDSKKKLLLLVCETNRAMYNVVLKRIEFEWFCIKALEIF